MVEEHQKVVGITNSSLNSRKNLPIKFYSRILFEILKYSSSEIIKSKLKTSPKCMRRFFQNSKLVLISISSEILVDTFSVKNTFTSDKMFNVSPFFAEK